jgi:hypothetical protein
MLANGKQLAMHEGGDKDAFLSIYQENYNNLFSYGFTLSCDK